MVVCVSEMLSNGRARDQGGFVCHDSGRLTIESGKIGKDRQGAANGYRQHKTQDISRLYDLISLMLQLTARYPSFRQSAPTARKPVQGEHWQCPSEPARCLTASHGVYSAKDAKSSACCAADPVNR